MAHTTIINGTIYEKSKGKDLAGGTVYEKDHGKTLVGGTVYEVGFAKPATITIDTEFAGSDSLTVSVDGVSCADGTITVPVGTVIEISAFNLSCYKGCSDGSAEVYINDASVAYESEGIRYSYTVTGNAIIRCAVNPSYCRDCGNYAYYAQIDITEIPEGHVVLTVQGSGGTVLIDGIYYSYETVVVPIGTIVTLDNRNYSYKDKESYIRVNGITVLDGCGSYDYIATVNATINSSSSRTDDDCYYYFIDVIEEI